MDESSERPRQKSPRRHFDRQFKLDAIHLVTEGGHSFSEVAREIGIRPELLRRWKEQLLPSAEGHAGAPTTTRPDGGMVVKTPEQLEIEALKRKLARVEEEREILKKAMAVFSQRP